MQKKIFGISLFIGLLSVLAGFAQNPIVQTYYTADPAPMVHNGTVYLYTSHDEDVTVKNFFTMNDWRCYSSKDMVNWTDHGAILSYKAFNWSRGDAWAGQCIFRNGKFYYYLPVNQKNGGNAIGVAVSDSPTAGFKDAIGKPLLSGFGYIDPSVFIDDDGHAYLYWGNPQLYYVKLNKDMISYDEKVGIVKVPLTRQGFSARKKDPEKRPSEYEEGPWFFKRKSKYYLIYPAGGVPEHLAYSTSNGPTGPWIYGDTIMKVIEDRGAFTNHPGYIDFKGQSYLFYHDGSLPGGGGFKRSVCIEPFSFNPDGSIPRINHTQSGVLKSVSNLDPFSPVEAETIAWSEGVKTDQDSLTGTIFVSNIDHGDYIKIRSVDFGKGATKFEATVASLSSKGNIELRADSLNGKLLGILEVKSTKNAQNWKAQLCKTNQITGIHDLYLVFKGEGNNLFNFDSWRFIR
ncbi:MULTISPECIES: glycoside hydrolase family 43 protein [unclassified Pedobacter]|uniref:glycoside hydrolase family 43 protein n=1 Tax=unclassified Pedobacter TaxID=2628915 RepID=UPI0014201AD8|nr:MULTISPECIES: glycoside hydrolase family 43 protein [unclassified Pedobacter]NII81149.1 beta-xylosidase [Pedobacter sp. SG908]NMN35166.1 beta-xylosidase [Pedobacter sp. SG918]